MSDGAAGLPAQSLSLLGHEDCHLAGPLSCGSPVVLDAWGHLCARTLGAAAHSQGRHIAKRLLLLAVLTDSLGSRARGPDGQGNCGPRFKASARPQLSLMEVLPASLLWRSQQEA